MEGKGRDLKGSEERRKDRDRRVSGRTKGESEEVESPVGRKSRDERKSEERERGKD